MNAETLNQKIEKLAIEKAAQHVRRMEKAINDAGISVCKGPNSEWFIDTFQQVLAVVGPNFGRQGKIKLPVSKELQDFYRSQILDEILTKIPLIKELVDIHEELKS